MTLAEVLGECDRDRGTQGNRAFYLATPPGLFATIAVSLGKAGLNFGDGDGWARVVIEKPFGWDEESSRQLYADIEPVFDENRIFRIDHYLAKDPVQNLLAPRFAHTILEPISTLTRL